MRHAPPPSAPAMPPVPCLRLSGEGECCGLFNEDGSPMLSAPLVGDNALPLNLKKLASMARPYETHPSDHPLVRSLHERTRPWWHLCEIDNNAFVDMMQMFRTMGAQVSVVEGGRPLFGGLRDHVGLSFAPVYGAFDVVWRNVEFRVISEITGPNNPWSAVGYIKYVAAEKLESIRMLLDDVQNFHVPSLGTIIVYKNGPYFDDRLRESISSYGWSDLVLPEHIKNDIKTNAERFFSDKARDLYTKMGIPYKRGFLLAGPPGCGKSLTAKIIASKLGVSFVYVTAMNGGAGRSPDDCIEEVFRMAREHAPCVLCFEDLDSQISQHNRTMFLNALDGFEPNDGVLTIATTNNPGDIDPALIDRASRFDKKWVFAKPASTERTAYLLDRVKRLLGLDTLSPAVITEIDSLSTKTNDFSFAHLQELVLLAGFGMMYSANDHDVVGFLRAALADTTEQVDLGAPGRLADALEGKPARMGLARLSKP